MSLTLHLMQERGILVDSDLEYEIARRDKLGFELTLHGVSLAEATNQRGVWHVISTDRQYRLSTIDASQPSVTISHEGSTLGEVRRTGRLPERMAVAMNPVEHPAIETFIAVVVMIAWRRLVAEASWDSQPEASF